MPVFRSSFHNHTSLSPCADISMTPDIYKEVLIESGVDWIAITDHNSAKNLKSFIDSIEYSGIKVLPGIEVQSVEEVHILVYFKSVEEAIIFGQEIEDSLLLKEFDPERFGYQILVDEEGNFTETIDSPYLGSPSKYTVEEIFKLARKYETIIAPAHIFRSFGLITQLGIPPSIEFDAVEVKSEKELNRALKMGYTRFIYGNDAHFPQELSTFACLTECENRTFDDLKKAIYTGKVIPEWQH